MRQVDLEDYPGVRRTQSRLGIEIPPGGFGVILADPPWSFKTWSGKTGTPHRTANDPYTTVESIALADMPVGDLAARDCALFMWVVDSHLPDAIALAAAWGFAFKTRAFDWVKTTKNGLPKIGMGYWTRKQTEECLLFTRGSPRRISKGVRQLIMAPRREHSRKPDEVYDRIQALVAGPYLELFARQSWPGWTAWGNQTDKFEAPGSPALPSHVPVRPAGHHPDLPLRESRDGRPEGRGPDGQAGSRDEPARAAAGPALATTRG